MARETKIGIALMVLLVGVFGAMVYKKWNSRRPTAVAAAAVAPAQADVDEPAGEDEPIASHSTEVEATLGGPTPAPELEPTDANPFAMTGTAPPTAQSEPDDPFADSGFVRSDQSPTETVDGEMQPVADTPPAQAEPLAATESPFAIPDDVATNVQPVPMAGTAPEQAAVMAAQPGAADVLPAGADVSDPFAEPVATTAPPQTVVEAPQQPAPVDDPFGTVAESPIEPSTVAESDPRTATTSTGDAAETFAATDAPTTPGSGAPAAAEDDPFAEPVSIAADGVGAMPAGESQEPDAPLASDPFAPAGEPAAETAAADVAPGRFPEGSAVPVAGGGEATAMQDSPFDPAEPAPEPVAQPETPAGQLKHYVVAENDSYWSISKRVYGTPIFFHALARFNSERVPNPERLKPGMKILTPPPQELSARFPKLVSSGTTVERTKAGQTSEPGFLFDDEGRPAYRVDEDDTLTGIAHAHLGRASRWVQIYEMNRTTVPDPKTLKPGTVLRLPADASRVRLVPEG
ncbi:MAG: LysM peptidoglycan-binding domain-containing protein [Planctomycetaceae bacterium]